MINTLKGWTGIQRELEGLEKQAVRNLLRVNEGNAESFSWEGLSLAMTGWGCLAGQKALGDTADRELQRSQQQSVVASWAA